jgi:hypothetical protein
VKKTKGTVIRIAEGIDHGVRGWRAGPSVQPAGSFAPLEPEENDGPHFVIYLDVQPKTAAGERCMPRGWRRSSGGDR